jgi:hypothetical protein
MSVESNFSPVDVIYDSRSYDRAADNIENNRDRPTFSIGLPTNENDLAGMSVMWVNVPFTFYTVDQTNNKGLWIKFPDHSAIGQEGGVAKMWHQLELLPGTYQSVAALQAEFRRALRASAFSFVNGGGSPAGNRSLDVSRWYLKVSESTGILTVYNEELLVGAAYGGTAGGEREFWMLCEDKSLADMMGMICYNDGAGMPSTNTARNAIQSTEKGVYTFGYDRLWNSAGVANSGNPVPYISASFPVKLGGQTRLNLHSNLNSSVRNDPAITVDDTSENKILSFPINNIFRNYITFSNNNVMIPIDDGKSIPSKIDFYLTHGDRKRYARSDPNDPSRIQYVDYVPLNGEGFQVCIRYFIKGVK